MPSCFVATPDSDLDYAFNWSQWLQSGETIVSYVLTTDSGITAYKDSESSGRVVVWLSGGTIGQSYKVVCKITTSEGRTDERTMYIKIEHR